MNAIYMEQSNAKHFALQLGALIALYLSIGAIIHLVFGIITIKFPDELAGYWEKNAASDSMRLSISLLIVAFPVYVMLTRLINTARRAGATYLPFTKWLIYLSLLVGGIVLLGDLVFIIYNFLNGELTTRFLLKALTVLIVVGSAFTYYVYDARGYWQKEEQKSKAYGIGVGILVLVAIVVGYLNIENPTEVREQKADSKEISDLSTLQSFVMNQYAVSNTLPEALSELQMFGALPEAPTGRAPYTYTRVKEDTFKLCAEFAYPSENNGYTTPYYESTGAMIWNPDDWSHKAGNWCFTRVVNPPSQLEAPRIPTKI